MVEDAKDLQWSEIIEPHASPFNFRLGELWQARDLIVLFVYRDFVAQFKQTILGPLWHFVQPLLNTVIFTVVFGKIARIPTDGVPPFLFYMAGTVLWTYFSTVLTATANTFTANIHLFGKIYFPRLAVPISYLISRLVALGIQFFFFLCFCIYFMMQGAAICFNPWILATPLLILDLAALALGLGIIVSSLTTKYRDLGVLITFGIQLLMYASPIVYPLSSIPERWRTLAGLNPIAPVVETFRHAFLGTPGVSLSLLASSILLTSLILLVALVLFNRVEQTFIDTI